MHSFSRLYSSELDGVEARLIEVEADVRSGMHAFIIVGLADKALSESKERIDAALKNTGVKPPSKEHRKVVINLAPADVKKTGSQYDLAMAIGFLLSSGQMKPFDTKQFLFLGELALNGSVRSVSGVMNSTQRAQEAGISTVVVPAVDAREAALIEGVIVIPVETLRACIDHLEGKKIITPEPPTIPETSSYTGALLTDIKGQETAKAALILAAAGGHNLLMSGPPGTGKTMLAQSLLSLLPAPSRSEIIEMTRIYSAAGLLGGEPYMKSRPFRAPHQTASPVSIIGGGTHPRPGEISLAHRGVLFLDELPEFRRDLLEALRQPLESGSTVVTRVSGTLTFPARSLLVAAMNPCPCGYAGDSEKPCRCSDYEIARYQKKISGPLLDRIDLHIHVPRVAVETLRSKTTSSEDNLKEIQGKILSARKLQHARLGTSAVGTGRLNSDMTSREVDEFIRLEGEAESFVRSLSTKHLLSPRSLYRILKTAQTIADLEVAEIVTQAHLTQAFSFRLRLQEA